MNISHALCSPKHFINPFQESIVLRFYKLSFSLIFPLLSFCSQDIKEASKASGQVGSIIPIASRQQISAAAYLADHIYKNYPPSHYIYLYVGQSPSIIYATFTSALDRIPDPPTQIALPLSKAKYIRTKIIPEIVSKDGGWHSGTDYFQTLIEHFDTYLELELLKEIQDPRPNGPRKLLLIDYAASGDSLGASKQALDYYLRFKSADSEVYKAFLSLKSEYFAMTNFNDELGVLKARVDAAKIAYPVKMPSFIEFLPIEENGQSLPHTVDMHKRIAAINQNTTAELWHWRGEVFDLRSLPNGKALIEGFFYQSFDDHSPYGSWDIRYDTAHSQKNISVQFIRLIHALRSCVQ